MTTPTVIALTQEGMATARRIAAAVPGAEVHGLGARTEGAAVTFEDTAAHARALFAAGGPIIGVCAAGILVRALAPVLVDKSAEPPVLAVAEDGSSVVPLLGGHGGGNALAGTLADVLDGHAAITTAGDVRFGFGLDAPPAGWRVANRRAAKGVAAALLAGEPVALSVDAGDAGWLTASGLSYADDAAKRICVTDQAMAGDGDTLVLHPPVLVVGVGCERGTDPDEATALVRETLARAGLAEGAVACVASIDVKADEAAVHAVAKMLDVPARFFDAATLEAETPRLAQPSDVVFAEVGCHGVSEGAALAAAGPGALLTVEKRKSKRATCAVARAKATVDAPAVGRAQGRLTVVGIGPGQDGWRTPEATAALAAATDVVGYGLYLDLVRDLIAGKATHHSELAEEEARVRKALDLAAEGRDVALVSSGDAGIYALAALAFELLDREDRDDWNRVALSVTPGVSAFQAAAARIGAPMGHDFCTISLSDLLTPFEEIERRLKAAAEGDFVVAFYNPVSKRRRTQLATARDILLTGRPPETPVVLARNLGRDGEDIRVLTLGELTPDHADMLTMVVVGNRQTRHMVRGVREWVYTPRGYAKKLS